MEIDKELWPTKQLQKTLNRIGVMSSPKYDLKLQEGIVDVTTDESSKQQLKQYSPNIKLIGFELAAERRGKGWGGTMVRTLRDSTDDRRCL